jgi:hypothetical protein
LVLWVLIFNEFIQNRKIVESSKKALLQKDKLKDFEIIEVQFSCKFENLNWQDNLIYVILLKNIPNLF